MTEGCADTAPPSPRRARLTRTFTRVRGLRYHLSSWGDPQSPTVLLLHGWMDAGATFQFLADHLSSQFHLVAPDWRGFGRSQWAGDAYWFPDYLGDLDALLEQVCPDKQALLVGHSMGGNVACLYAGIRPERVARVASLEGFGLPDGETQGAPARYREWLDGLRGEPRPFRPYPSLDAFAERLRRDNPRLDVERARFIARAWGRRLADGGWIARADPRQRLRHAQLYRRAEAEACWRAVRAPTLFVGGSESDFRRWLGDEDVEATARACFRDLRFTWLDGAGHMLHHDKPAQLAGVLGDFLRGDEANVTNA